MNYSQLESQLGKKVMDQCSTLYQKYVVSNMGQGKSKDLWNGVETYLARITPLLGGGINTKELLEYLQETRFFDQVVILAHYLVIQQENKKENKDKVKEN